MSQPLLRPTHVRPQLDSAPYAPVPAVTPPPAPALNTILAVREHAPAEIRELESEIATMQSRLAAAHARKRLLEELLRVITSAETPPNPGMTVVR